MSNNQNKNGPLKGVRVLELGHFIAAPFCTRLMADLGADVIKVEPPAKGDPVRQWGEMIDGKSVWWSVHGRNKRSVTLNLKHERARETVLAMVAECDIVVENFRPGQLEKWGLGPDALGAARPGLVMVRISGYGQSGPYKSKAAFGVIGEAIGGIRHLTAYPAGSTAEDLPPIRTGISFGDSVAGLYGAFGAMVALHEQRSSDNPQPVRVVDVALTESVLSLLEGCIPEYSALGKIRQPSGSTLPTNAPSNAYRCADGAWVLIAANSDPLFNKLCTTMDRTELLDNPDYRDNPSRVANAVRLDAEISAWTAGLASDEVSRLMEKADIPSTKIYTIEDCIRDPQFLAREMVREVEDPRFGRLLHPGVVPAFGSGTAAGGIFWTGPEVGEHNDNIYCELLGKSQSELAAMKKEGLV
ncbi:MAG: CoA transferase [Oceanospirillaceae bacterium]|nr:CoA transferase [Oceanospirillaceae bacterium]